MWLFGHKPRAKHKRRHERYNTEWLRTPLGKVVDLSESGLRIQGKGQTALKAGQVIPVRLHSLQGELGFIGQIAWVSRPRRGEYEAGIKLLDVKPHVAKVLKQLAQLGFVPECDSAAAAETAAAEAAARGVAARPPLGTPDPYVVLGIDPSASDEQVQLAYRSLAKKLHPDVNRTAEAAEEFEKVTAAYRTVQRRRLRISAPAA
jgi:hypothetical protein